jgi:hypothetical protein
MSNITITQPIDLGSVIYSEPVHEDDSLYFSAEDTFVEGTLLARRHTSADSYAGVITGTGTRVATLSAPAGKLKVGAYTLVAGTLTSGVGSWTLTDPDGQSAQYTTAAATGNLFFPGLGVFVDIADTGTNFVTADSVAFTVADGSGYRPFSPSGGNGSQYPAAVLTYEAYKASSGSLPIRALVGGKVRKERLIIDADGDGDNITQAHVDALRANGIFALSVRDLSVLDNA